MMAWRLRAAGALAAMALTPLATVALAPPAVAADTSGHATAVDASSTAAEDHSSEALPRHELFSPLLADPRWPHMAAAWQDWGNDQGFRNIAAVSLGGALPIYQRDSLGGRWELGLKGAVFSVLNLDTSPKSLINADYYIGIPVAYRRDDWSGFVEVLHQSSHVGDQYLIAHPDFQRFEVSYEAVDLIVSRFFSEHTLRFYGGGKYYFDREPTAQKAFSVQGGAEWRSPRAYVGDLLRPFAALDLEASQTTDWDPQLSFRTGIQMVGGRHDGSDSYTLQLSLDFYRGRNLNGQFFYQDNVVDYWGFGLHAYF